MDKFDQTLKTLMKLSPAEFSGKIESLKKMCPCPTCPTYNVCAKNGKEVLFCITGKSFTCISKDTGCICPTCPLGKEVGLTHDRFCLKGAEMSQRYMENLK